MNCTMGKVLKKRVDAKKVNLVPHLASRKPLNVAVEGAGCPTYGMQPCWCLQAWLSKITRFVHTIFSIACNLTNVKGKVKL